MFKLLAALVIAVILAAPVITLVPGLQENISDQLGISKLIRSRLAPIVDAQQAIDSLKTGDRPGLCPAGWAELNAALAEPVCVDGEAH